MDWKPEIQKWYTLGFITAEQVGLFVTAGWITQADADAILAS